MLAPDDEEAFAAEEEKFKVALHYTVGKLSQKATEDRSRRELFRFADQPSQCMPANFSKPVIAALSEVTWDMMEHWAKDLEAFAKHAKRSVINADDVRLLTRRSPALTALLEKTIELQAPVANGPAENINRSKEPSPNRDDPGPSTADDVDQPTEIIEDTSPGNSREDAARIEDDDLDAIIMNLNEDELLGSRRKEDENDRIAMEMDDHWRIDDSAGTSKSNAPDARSMDNGPKGPPRATVPNSTTSTIDDEWEPFQLPEQYANMTFTEAEIERRRRSANGRHSLGSFDCRWWEDPA